MSNLATWFTPSLQTISRSSGRSSVLAAAYRACVKLTDERLGTTTDYTPKGKHGLAGNLALASLAMTLESCGTMQKKQKHASTPQLPAS